MIYTFFWICLNLYDWLIGKCANIAPLGANAHSNGHFFKINPPRCRLRNFPADKNCLMPLALFIQLRFIVQLGSLLLCCLLSGLLLEFYYLFIGLELY